MEISIEPEPEPEEREALLAALAGPEPAESPWRRAALEEGVEPYPE